MTAAEATPEFNIYYLAFFAGNSMVGYVGGFLETMPITRFWLLHAGFAAAATVAFIVFKLLLSKRLTAAEPVPLPS